MTASRTSQIFISAAAMLTLSSPAIAQPSGVCFGPRDKPSISILENAPPPDTDGQTSYSFYPATAVATMQLPALVSSRATLPKYYWQWGNHGPRRVEKGNIAPGVSGRMRSVAIDFSTPEAADACTLAQTAAVLGAAQQASLYAAQHHLTLVSVPPSVSEAQDVCILPGQRLPSGDGVLLDYEVHDGRSRSEAVAFLTEYASLVHSTHRPVILYTNPLDAPTQVKSGLYGDDIGSISSAFDQVSVFLWPGNRQGDIRSSYQSQIRMLGGQRSKILLVFELNDSTMMDAAAVRQIAMADRPAGVAFWRHGAQISGDCADPVNRKIACVAFGRCVE